MEEAAGEGLAGLDPLQVRPEDAGRRSTRQRVGPVCVVVEGPGRTVAVVRDQGEPQRDAAHRTRAEAARGRGHVRDDRPLCRGIGELEDPARQGGVGHDHSSQLIVVVVVVLGELEDPEADGRRGGQGAGQA